jgi:hypothetical protein
MLVGEHPFYPWLNLAEQCIRKVVGDFACVHVSVACLDLRVSRSWGGSLLSALANFLASFSV